MIKIRPSGILKFENCPLSYHLQYELGWRADIESANLAFGTAVHAAVTGWITDQALGKHEQDILPLERFRVAWKDEINKKTLEFSSSFTPDEMGLVGERLMELFPSVWESLGLIPIFDDDGPLIERRMEVEVVDGVIISGQPDFVGMNRDSRVTVIDFKTPTNPSTEEFAVLSDQLTCYQVLVEAHKDATGIERVDYLAFMELLKRKEPKRGRGEGPQVLEPVFCPRRDEARLREFKTKVGWIAEDIQRGRFPRTPRMAWNSPCHMCDYKGFCSAGCLEGLVDEKGQPIKTIPIALAA